MCSSPGWLIGHMILFDSDDLWHQVTISSLGTGTEILQYSVFLFWQVGVMVNLHCQLDEIQKQIETHL